MHGIGPIFWAATWLTGVRRSHFSSLNIRIRSWRWLFGVSQEQLQRDYWEELDGVLDFRLQELLRDHVARNRLDP